MNPKEEIVKTILQLSGKYSAQEIFTDWVRCCALSISNSTGVKHDKTWEEREKMYLSTMDRYTAEEQKQFPQMLGLLGMELEKTFSDVLGSVYMELNGKQNNRTIFYSIPFKFALCQSGRDTEGRRRKILHK